MKRVKENQTYTDNDPARIRQPQDMIRETSTFYVQNAPSESGHSQCNTIADHSHTYQQYQNCSSSGQNVNSPLRFPSPQDLTYPNTGVSHQPLQNQHSVRYMVSQFPSNHYPQQQQQQPHQFHEPEMRPSAQTIDNTARNYYRVSRPPPDGRPPYPVVANTVPSNTHVTNGVGYLPVPPHYEPHVQPQFVPPQSKSNAPAQHDQMLYPQLPFHQPPFHPVFHRPYISMPNVNTTPNASIQTNLSVGTQTSTGSNIRTTSLPSPSFNSDNYGNRNDSNRFNSFSPKYYSLDYYPTYQPYPMAPTVSSTGSSTNGYDMVSFHMGNQYRNRNGLVGAQTQYDLTNNNNYIKTGIEDTTNDSAKPEAGMSAIPNNNGQTPKVSLCDSNSEVGIHIKENKASSANVQESLSSSDENDATDPKNTEKKKLAFGLPVWTKKDDKLLQYLREREKLGWKDISSYFPDRTINACQFRWRRINLKKENKVKKELKKKAIEERIRLKHFSGVSND